MEIKAKLRIQLLADEVVVAESNDPALWNRVLQLAQQTAEIPKLLTHNPLSEERGAYMESSAMKSNDSTISPLEQLSQTLGIPPQAIQGACYPSHDKPYLRMDSHYWTAFKKNTPKRGTGTVSPDALASTLMLQWFKYANLGEVNRSMIYEVLDDLGLPHKNFDRAIKNCSWLAIHNSTLKLNPSAIDKADAVMKAFCMKQSVDNNE